ncbi:TIGR00266 family protein [Hahella sp. CCB-MM4]|uniref:TIGR00266 family protein n=1 Tax=Hahella sp. (strain CCB-MM4) TaxID=1926491 RepID=UPI000B9B4DDA|nr:TIGR00266 family protein [Hahella sp. CCB-MM4]OZG71555.1 TIGR00266 family protein [Hahella sp. CCB-MM4]
MKAEIKGGSAFSYLDVELEAGESITAESDAMSSMSAELDMATRPNGSVISALLKKLLGGETFFINRFSNNTGGPCKLTLVQPTPGEIRCAELNGDSLCLQPGAFMAATEGVTLGLRWAGFTSFIAREGLFKLVVSGNGKVWYGAYGALLEREIDGEYIVDTSHLVAYDPSLRLKLQLAGGLFSSFFGGEGLVTRVEGKGKVVIQSRSISGLTSWINPKLY